MFYCKWGFEVIVKKMLDTDDKDKDVALVKKMLVSYLMSRGLLL